MPQIDIRAEDGTLIKSVPANPGDPLDIWALCSAISEAAKVEMATAAARQDLVPPSNVVSAGGAA